jgi:CRISPR-associated protein Cmr5
MSAQQSLEQKRAATAWGCIADVRSKKFAKEYGALARNAPADIQSNGLGQALAFWRAKGKKGDNEHTHLLNDVSKWVGKQIKDDENLDLLEWVIKDANTNDYRRATAEAMAFLQWLKRFAEAELEDKSTSSREAA